jgi:glycosyltransferase 2 family protein
MGWVVNGANLSRIWGEMRRMHWAWVAAAIVFDISVYLLHGLRWSLLLRPLERVPFLQALQAIYVGLFTNEVFPLRAGELIRCFLLSKSTRIPLSVVFASALIERIFDGIWLMACFGAAIHMGKLPGVLLKGGYILGVLIVLLGLLLGYAMYARQQSLGLMFGLAWPGWFNTLIEDLHLIGHSRYLYYSFLVSGFYLLAQILPIYALVRASSLPVPWTASFVMMVLLRLSSILPQAPGNLGSFQWVSARTLIMFGLVAAHAKRFSLILWALVTFPLIIIGFIAVAMEGINLTHLHREATSAAGQSGKALKNDE